MRQDESVCLASCDSAQAGTTSSAIDLIKHAHFPELSVVGLFALCLFAFFMGYANPMSAQTQTGRILGAVTDQSGGVLPGATVTVTDVQRGISRTLVTDGDGAYVASSLLPGTYMVRVQAAGFKTFDRPDILLEVAKDVRMDFTLQPGEQTTQIIVSGNAEMVDSTNATLGGTLSNQTINDLPLNGRNYENLLQLRPGVFRFPGGGPDTSSTNGLRPSDQNYMVDGFDNNEPFWSMSVIGGDSTTLNILPIDAIQEFNTEENPPAEYGWKPGAVVNVGLKSGTNTLHGTGYAFGRDSAWDARNYFNAVPQPVQPLNLEQFGGTVGGAVVKEKLFFFAGYEGQRYTVGNTYQARVPTSAAGAGTLISIPDAEADLATHGIPVSALSESLLKYYGTNTGTSKVVPNGFPNSNQDDNGLLKFDYHLNDRNALSFMYFIGNFNLFQEDITYLQPQWLTQQYGRAQVFGFNWAWTPNSIWANEARFSYVRSEDNIVTSDHTVPPATYGLNTGVTDPLHYGMPGIAVTGFTTLGGISGWPAIEAPDQAYQFIDHVSYVRGKHLFKFGVEARRGSSTALKDRAGKGSITFGANTAFPGATPLEDFLAGSPQSGQLLEGTTRVSVNNWQIAEFAQDDWRINSRLTVSLGLRYELATVMHPTNGGLGNFDPTVGLVQVGQQIQSVFNGDHNNFAPRLGVAWDVRGDGKTVVRLGGGIFYDTIAYNAFLSLFGVNNSSTVSMSATPTGALGVGPGGSKGTGTITVGAIKFPATALNWNGSAVGGPSIFPAGAVDCNPNVLNPSTGQFGSPCDILATNPNLRNPYVSTWTLDVQHAVTPNMMLEVAYVGNHGTKLLSIQNINQADPNSPAAIAAGISPNNTIAQQAGRPFNVQFPYLRAINWLSNGDESNYNGLQATFTKRMSHGLSILAGYTYSHALDDLSDNRGINPMDSTRPGLQYGSSDFDVTHRFTLSTTYTLPGRESPLQMLTGWQLNSIVTIQSGQPWDVTDTGDDISETGENSDRWDFFGNHADFKSTQDSIPQCVGTDFSAPSTITCTQTVPGGSVTLPAAQTAAFASACLSAATAINAATVASLDQFGCFAKGKSVMIPPALGTFGTMGRNVFRDSGFRGWDLSVTKNWKVKERLTAQFRAEFFNVLNHPLFANPAGENRAYGLNDPSAGQFGCGCATPDVAAANPVLGSGSNRAIQLGLKLIF
jgi:Carboxypeptidase regulatory-like domain